MNKILFSAKEFAEYLNKCDADAFCRDGISDEQHKHLLDVAEQLMDDIDNILDSYSSGNMCFSSLEELYVTLDLGLPDWNISKKFWKDFLYELVAAKAANWCENSFDDVIFQSIFSTPNMVKLGINDGIFDSVIRNDNISFLEFIESLQDDLNYQYSCLNVLCIAKAWCKRARKLGICIE